MVDASEAAAVIPLVDFTDFDEGKGPRAKEVGDAFYAACRDVGFVYISNFGIPQSAVDEIFDWSRRYFELPKDVKMLAEHPKGEREWHHRGYSDYGPTGPPMIPDEKNGDLPPESKGKFPSHHESFDYGRLDHPRLPNIIQPDSHLPGFQAALDRYFEHGRRASITLLKALAIGMPDVPPNFFEEYHAWGDNQIRLLFYPPQDTERLKSGEVGRIGEHTDFGSGTILFQDDTGGLEVEDPNRPGVFVQAKPVPGTAVFNIGDFMQRWSNGVLKSTLHRVRCPPSFTGPTTPTRYSIPYFFKADPDKIIECLPGTWNETDRPKLYGPITAREWVDAKHMRRAKTRAAGSGARY
ncbi:hypothetical protein IAT38_004149 [Cryptococcus sp. DSM 104549]